MAEKSMEICEIAQDSVELKRGAKGQYSWNIKIYFSDHNGLSATDQAETIDARLRHKFLMEE